MLVVLTTTPNAEEAGRLARSIVDARLAACVQLVPQMTSIYFWEGKLETEQEHLLLIKTLEAKYDELCEFIRANHSYGVPEIIAIEAAKVSEDYLNWMRDYIASYPSEEQPS